MPSPDDLSNVFALLTWRTRIVPLIGQDNQLESLIAWATSNAAGPKIRFLAGEGGSGKSRIAAELAQRLHDDHGIKAGFLKLERTVAIPKQRTLFIVDYPEERREFTRALFRELAAQPNWSVRLLLLSRRPIDGWYDEVNAANVLHLVDQQRFAVESLSDNNAARLFEALLDELRTRYGAALPQIQLSAFREWSERSPYLHRRPLFIIAAAVHAAIDPAHALQFTVQGVIDALVLRERGRMQRVSRDVGFEENAGPRLAALAAIRGGFGPNELARFADPALNLGLSKSDSVGDAVRRVPWWNDNAWLAPQPDILAAALMYSELKRKPELAPDWLWSALGDLPPKMILDQLTRLVHDVGTVYGSGQQLLIQWLAKMVEVDVSRAIALSLFAREELPVSLAPFGVAVCRVLLRSAALTARDRAILLHNLCVQLSRTGDRAGALSAIEEGIKIRRRLKATERVVFHVELAESLNNLCVQQSESGDHDGALRSIEEALDILRPLAATQPAAVEIHLARSLNNLSVELKATGDRSGALQAIEEAVEIRRGLAARDPARFEPDLARSLNNLSNQLDADGDSVAALQAIEEALEIHRRLAALAPAAFEPALAASLVNLAVRLNQANDQAGSLRAIEEAVGMYRRLANAQPTAFEPYLARSLHNLSNRLSARGDRAGAVRALKEMNEAVEIFRRLARAQPAVFEPRLADSLNNLSLVLSACDERDGALRAMQEAIDIRRRLQAATDSAANEHLAASLYSLSEQLSDADRPDDAMRAIEESVTMYRRLAQVQPTVFETDLANSLHVLSSQLIERGDYVDALPRLEEVVAIRRRSLAGEPGAASRAQLAVTLNTLSALLIECDDLAGALDAIDEAVDLWRLAVVTRPEDNDGLTLALQTRDWLIAQER